MMKKYIIIKADNNDADYVTSKESITDERLEIIMPVIETLKNSEKRHNWPTHEYVDATPYQKYKNLTEEQIDYFNEYIPYSEYGIHTIESIEILEVANEVKLL